MPKTVEIDDQPLKHLSAQSPDFNTIGPFLWERKNKSLQLKPRKFQRIRITAQRNEKKYRMGKPKKLEIHYHI